MRLAHDRERWERGEGRVSQGFSRVRVQSTDYSSVEKAPKSPIPMALVAFVSSLRPSQLTTWNPTFPITQVAGSSIPVRSPLKANYASESPIDPNQ